MSRSDFLGRFFFLGAVVAVVGCGLTGCKDRSLVSSSGELMFSEKTLVFDDTYTGKETTLLIEVINQGRGTLPVFWRLDEGPFFADELPDELPSGATPLHVRFSPNEAGIHKRLLQVRTDEGSAAAVLLLGTGKLVPVCTQAVQCQSSAFDFESETCVESPVPDGTFCDPHDVCLRETLCQGGTCVGLRQDCDDQDACTVDVCDPLDGCKHLPRPPCPATQKCTVGACRSDVGCVEEPAPDGILCGAFSCELADVCIAGQCVVRDPPDGFVCAEASPCQGEGRCVGSSCERPTAGTLSPAWVLDTAALATPTVLHDFVVEPDGAISQMGFFVRPSLRANRAGAGFAQEGARRCFLWNGRLVCTDYLTGARSGQVALVDLASGAALWVFDVLAARPDFAALIQPGHMFMARTVSLGSDRLAALFEALPAGKDPGTLCRSFFLVVLDAGGAMVAADKLDDPIFSVCDHPHPYGIASDTVGNLYLDFSPSVTTGGPPLLAGSPSLVFSFSPTGTLRWKTQHPFRGGELAVGRGQLFPEWGDSPLDAQTGLALAPWRTLGRAMVSGSRTILGPLDVSIPGGGTVEAYSAAGKAWSYAFPPGRAFSLEARLASWQSPSRTAPEEVVLLFDDRAASGALTAVRVKDGSEAWSCALSFAYRGGPVPQLFEVTRGAVTSMGGADTCGQCDPPFANSSALFQQLPVPGLDSSFAPWTGTFAGAGHDHHEKGFVPAWGPRQ